MYGLSVENWATILIDGSTVFLLLGVFLETSIMRKRNREDDKLFFILLFLDIIMALADIPSYLIDKREFPGGRIINIASMTVFYVAMAFLCMAFLHYFIVRFVGMDSSVSKKKHTPFFVPGLLVEVLLIVNIFAGFFFNVDENNYYHHGILYIPFMVMMFAYLIAGFIIIARYRTGMDKKTLIPVWIYVLPVVVGLVVPFVFGGISLTSIGCGMSIVFTHLGSASELVQSDVKGGEAA